jgi:tetratricopeptide (TPR) repeat protein
MADWRRVVDIDCLRAVGRQVAAWASTTATWIGNHLFKLSAWIALPAFAWALGRELFSGKPGTELIVVLTALVLLAALAGQHGSDLIPRLKKLGPLELFQDELPSLLATLQREEVAKLPPAVNRNAFEPRTFQDDEIYLYQRWDLFVSLVEFWGLDVKKSSTQARYLDVLWFVASVAFSQKDWARAKARLETYCELVGDAGKVVAVLRYNLAMIEYHWAFDQTVDRRSRFELARDLLRQVVASDRDHYLAYFYLGYIHDELKNYGRAIENDLEALKIRPQFAPARYNAACSHVRSGKLAEGMEMLEGLQSGNQSIEEIRKALLEDDEIAPLRADAGFKVRIDALVARLAQPPLG